MDRSSSIVGDRSGADALRQDEQGLVSIFRPDLRWGTWARQATDRSRPRPRWAHDRRRHHDSVGRTRTRE